MGATNASFNGDVKQSNLIRQPDGTIAFVVDFTGAEMKKLPEDTPVTAQTSIGDNGEIVESTVRYNPVTKGWRLVMRVKVKDAKKTTEMRAALVNADQTLSETRATSYLPMNKTTEYIDAMPIAASEKAALPKTDIRAVHQALDAEHRTGRGRMIPRKAR